MVKDHLSPETLENYSLTPPAEQLQSELVVEGSGGNEGETGIHKQQSSNGKAQITEKNKETNKKTEVIIYFTKLSN